MNFNAGEIVVLVVLGVIFFGPEKLPDLARKAARVLRYLRGIANDARSQLRQELGPEFDDIRLADLNPRSFVRRHLMEEEAIIAHEVASARAGLASAAEDLRAVGTGRSRTPFDPEAT